MTEIDPNLENQYKTDPNGIPLTGTFFFFTPLVGIRGLIAVASTEDAPGTYREYMTAYMKGAERQIEILLESPASLYEEVKKRLGAEAFRLPYRPISNISDWDAHSEFCVWTPRGAGIPRMIMFKGPGDADTRMLNARNDCVCWFRALLNYRRGG